jgi:hypothetical protein
MRAIDLLSQMCSPVAAGFLMSYGSMLAAIAVLALYSLCAWVPECLLLQAAHRRSAALRCGSQGGGGSRKGSACESLQCMR